MSKITKEFIVSVEEQLEAQLDAVLFDYSEYLEREHNIVTGADDVAQFIDAASDISLHSLYAHYLMIVALFRQLCQFSFKNRINDKILNEFYHQCNTDELEFYSDMLKRVHNRIHGYSVTE